MENKCMLHYAAWMPTSVEFKRITNQHVIAQSALPPPATTARPRPKNRTASTCSCMPSICVSRFKPHHRFRHSPWSTDRKFRFRSSQLGKGQQRPCMATKPATSIAQLCSSALGQPARIMHSAGALELAHSNIVWTLGRADNSQTFCHRP